MGIIYILLILIILLIGFLQIRSYRLKRYFESKGVYYLGNSAWRLLKVRLRGDTVLDFVEGQYNEIRFKNYKVAGIDDFGLETLMITDLDLLKQVMIKDFDHFTDRRSFTKLDPMLNKMLILVQGDKWRALRSKMSPTFTTGKIRRMFRIFDESSKKLSKFVEKKMSQNGEIDLMDGYSKYALDVIASAAFGIDSKAFESEEQSLFEQMGSKVQIGFEGMELIKFIMHLVFPRLAVFLGLEFFTKEAKQFFDSVIKSTIKHRLESGEKREDFIQLMLEARQGLLKTDQGELSQFEKEAIIQDDKKAVDPKALNDEVISANCVLFILAGFDTTQSLLIFTAYALAIYPDVQDKLRKEVDAVLDDNDGSFTYDAVQQMQYMDMFINETLRFYPPAAITDRECTQDYKVPGTDLILKKGNGISISILGILHDERYFPEPDKFIPERFSPENKTKMHPYAFITFGFGPRNCIGMRFALAEVKLAIAHLVHDFTIEPSKNTPIPMKFQNNGSLKPVGGMKLALNKRC